MGLLPSLNCHINGVGIEGGGGVLRPYFFFLGGGGLLEMRYMERLTILSFLIQNPINAPLFCGLVCKGYSCGYLRDSIIAGKEDHVLPDASCNAGKLRAETSRTPDQSCVCPHELEKYIELERSVHILCYFNCNLIILGYYMMVLHLVFSHFQLLG